jgi:TetR/AcrR family transcriptional regulator, transcriptional repressor for nem operon
MEALLEEKLPDTKRKLIEAAVALMLRQGFTATTVDQVCAEAGVTKGSFFHYFKTKEEIGQASVRYFSQQQCEAIACAGLEKISDPLDRFHALLDCFAGMARHPQFPKACLVGNLTQELSQTHPEIRACCAESFEGFTTDVSRRIHPGLISIQPVSPRWC